MTSFYVKQNKIISNKILKKSTAINKNVISNHINISTSNRLIGKNASTDKLVYSSQDPYYNGVGQFIRNTSCWINGVSNISCFSPAQLSGASWNTRAGTLITTKHIIQAKHYPTTILPNGGTPIIFVDENNNVVRRNIIAYGYDDSDIAIGLLDQDVPNNIKIAKVLPTNFTDYFLCSINNDGGVNFNPLLYAFALDQEEKAILKLFFNIYKYTTNIIASGYAYMAYVPDINISSSYYASMNPQPTNFTSFFEAIVTGDSGNPVFLIIDDELVILTTWWGTTNGPFTTYKYDTINSIINTLSPSQGYSLTPINLDAVYQKYA
jgi:hypothetical protein